MLYKYSALLDNNKENTREKNLYSHRIFPNIKGNHLHF